MRHAPRRARRISVAAMDPEEFVEELWGYAHELEMREHPWFKGVVEHRWTREQIVLGEMQHYLRVSQNPVFFGYIVTNVAAEKNYDQIGRASCRERVESSVVARIHRKQ